MKKFFFFASKNYTLQKQVFQKKRGNFVFPLAFFLPSKPFPRKTKIIVKPFFFPVSFQNQRFFSKIGKIWLRQQKKWYKTTTFFITKKKRKTFGIVLKRIKTKKNRLYLFSRFRRIVLASEKQRGKFRFKTPTKVGVVKFHLKPGEVFLRSKKKAEVVFFAKQKKRTLFQSLKMKKKKILLKNITEWGCMNSNWLTPLGLKINPSKSKIYILLKQIIESNT